MQITLDVPLGARGPGDRCRLILDDLGELGVSSSSKFHEQAVPARLTRVRLAMRRGILFMNSFASQFAVSRRRFLRQSFAFSALAALGSLPGTAAPVPCDPAAGELLMVGDWGYDKEHSPQSAVATGMRQYTQRSRLEIQALLMLGDNWYGALYGGAHSTRWQTQFEQMYPADVFACPAYSIPDGATSSAVTSQTNG
jgi:hypothetical protein